MTQQHDQQPDQAVDITKRTGWALEVNLDSLPEPIRRMPFAVWTAEPRGDGKVNKIPRHPRGGWKLSVSDPDKWVTYAEALRAYDDGHYDGVGVLLTRDANIIGIDLDDWKTRAAAHPEIQAELEKFLSKGGYLERSPSGKGLRAFTKGTLPFDGRNKNGLEIYCHGRFLTVTGQSVEVLHD